MRRTAHAVVLAAALLAGGACVPHPVGPARTFAAYEGKARTTAASVLSAVQTVRLAAGAGSDDHGFGPYLSQVVSEQEDVVSGLQGTFGSIQPPDERADAVRHELDGLVSDALAHITEVRIAVRRGELRSLAAVAEPLAGDVDALDEFLQEHAP
jgi:hypothetical protein